MRALIAVLAAFGLPVTGITLHMSGNTFGDALLALWLAIGAITIFTFAYRVGKG